MKNKIAFKLIKYFTICLLLFSIIIGGFFMLFFRAKTIGRFKDEREEKALTISNRLTNYLVNQNQNIKGNGMSKAGKGQYFQGFLSQMDLSDVWIVDENLNLIEMGLPEDAYRPYSELPDHADSLVQLAFDGETSFSEDFSDLLKSPALTVGTPVYSNNVVIGVLLLHSPIDGLNDSIYKGFYILGLSMLLALVASIGISIALALSFTKPLNQMKHAASLLAQGDYSVKTGVSLDDEIGELAHTIDILSERLLLASEESQRLENMRRDFIANISHELRTPVTVIRGSLEALCDNVVTEKNQIEKYHTQMLSESIFLQRLVNDLLELSKLQSPDFKINLTELNLVDVVKDSIRVSRQLAMKKNININSVYSTDIIMINGDYDRLKQLLIILLDNAIKFSDKGSYITIEMNGNLISIKDSGPGIKEEDLPFIFDRFYKSTNSSNQLGTGLGLSIAKKIADRHDIAIKVKSQLGAGTTVDLFFKA